MLLLRNKGQKEPIAARQESTAGPNLGFKLILAYDGTDFVGWQENGTGPSIQGTVQDALKTILQHDVKLEGASRTDAGVHAEGQVALFSTNKAIEDTKVFRSLNSLLPPEIRVLALSKADDSFHPTLSSSGKVYRYQCCLSTIQLPHTRHYSWHVADKIDLDKVYAAAQQLVGTHDFSAFCNMRKDLRYETTIRTLRRVDIEVHETNMTIYIEGDSFMYKMVRNLVGTLIDIGRGKLAEDVLKRLLNGASRLEGGVTAPAHGLTLVEVHYLCPGQT